jgi:hypothetical protein
MITFDGAYENWTKVPCYVPGLDGAVGMFINALRFILYPAGATSLPLFSGIWDRNRRRLPPRRFR